KTGGQEKSGVLLKGFITDIYGTRSQMSDDDKIVLSGGSMEILLNGKPSCRSFDDKTLDEIVSEVLSQYPLSSKIKPRDTTRYPYIVQYNESDFEFIKRLSKRYGEWFFFNGSDIVFGEIPKKDLDMTIGYDLKNFRYQLKVRPVRFSLFSANPLNSEISEYRLQNGRADSNLNTHGKYALRESKKLFPNEGSEYYEHLNVKESAYGNGLELAGERDEISDAVNLSDVSGASTNPFLTSGIYIKVCCFGGKGTTKIPYLTYLVTSVQHSINNLLTYNNSFTAVPAETEIPANTDPFCIRAVQNQVGRVTDNCDPKNQGRVRVRFPWMSDNSSMTPWMKTITPYVQAKSGVYFVPAVGSRVLVGFEGGNVEKPLCLGNLYDDDYPPDQAWSGDFNSSDSKIHAIRTQSGQTIEFHDDSGNEKIRIYDTKNKNEITLDTANGEIKIKAAEKLTIEAKDISIKADAGIRIEAGQKLENKANEIKSEAKTSLEQKAMDIKSEATTSVGVKAASVEIKASASLKAEGSATAEVTSSGIMTVKGSVVMIN
ncbi:MAG TPA: phage baseplate assembly protein V, partial [Bacteroidales bacterium]|nr:phage baseplate assembly protein V [Bacteroidales bacterium]